MKKSLIALAVLATAGVASAQSSVTLFGIVDATLQHVTNSGGTKVTRLTNSGYNSSRLGFRGVEDLGGGMSASFWLEAGMNNDDGSGDPTNLNNQASGTGAAVAGRQGLTFNRRSTVSLAGGWGEVRLGRDYTPQFWNLTVFDPFGTNGVGTTQALNSIITGVTAVRASNSIGYFAPGKLGGFYGQPALSRENVSGYGRRRHRQRPARNGFANGPSMSPWLSARLNTPLAMKQNNIGGHGTRLA
jgi:predicted porin